MNARSLGLTGALCVSLWGGALSSRPLLAQTPPGDGQRVNALLAAAKYSATRVENPKQAVWTILRRGDQTGDYRVVVTVKDGMLITFVTVERKANIRKTPELVERILKMNFDYDYIKAGFDDDEDAYVRIDARLRIVDADEFNAIVEQVSQTTQGLYSMLQPFLVR